MDSSSMYMVIWILFGLFWDTSFKYQRILRAKHVTRSPPNLTENHSITLKLQELQPKQRSIARSLTRTLSARYDVVVRECCNTALGRPFVKSCIWFSSAFISWFLLMTDLAGCDNGGSLLLLLGIMVPLVSFIANWAVFPKCTLFRKGSTQIRESKGQSVAKR